MDTLGHQRVDLLQRIVIDADRQAELAHAARVAMRLNVAKRLGFLGTHYRLPSAARR